MAELHITTLKTLFLYVHNATWCIPDEHRERVFKDLALNLHDWENIPISVLRNELKNFDIEFNDRCCYCGNEMVDANDGQQFCSYACRVKDCGCKADPSCCGRD